MYDISGSAHFINKCDNGIVIHRNRDAKVGPLDGVQVHFSLFLIYFSVVPYLLQNLIHVLFIYIYTCSGLCSEGTK